MGDGLLDVADRFGRLAVRLTVVDDDRIRFGLFASFEKVHVKGQPADLKHAALSEEGTGAALVRIRHPIAEMPMLGC